VARSTVFALALVAGVALSLATPVVHATGPSSRAAAPAMRRPVSAVPSAKSPARPARAKTAAKATKDPTEGGHLTTPPDATDAPAYRYAQLSPAECEAELAARSIEFSREVASAVLAPVRLHGPLRGVVFRTDQSDKARPTSLWEVVDCRLVLALDDFAEILNRHGIVEVRHYSMYRPPKAWSDDKPGTRHTGALAIDAGRFIDQAGTVLDVDHDFHGAIGAKTCGDGAAPRPATPAAIELREILCEAADRRLFNVVLTPNYNRPHKNHFHLEITAGVSWFLVH
jgi:hypothetical protein